MHEVCSLNLNFFPRIIDLLFTTLLYLTYTENGIRVHTFVCFVKRTHMTSGVLAIVSQFAKYASKSFRLGLIGIRFVLKGFKHYGFGHGGVAFVV